MKQDEDKCNKKRWREQRRRDKNEREISSIIDLDSHHLHTERTEINADTGTTRNAIASRNFPAQTGYKKIHKLFFFTEKFYHTKR